ncbi:MAG: Ig-like domain-containing protein [Alphaproteobacteria bacterium]
MGTSAVSGALQSLNLALPGLGIVVGAFVGTALGTTFGNLFGGDDEPMAWAHISYSKENQEYYIGSNYGSDGGDPAVAQSMAQQVIDGINDIIDISHGKLREGTPAPRLQIGFEGNEFLVAADGGGAKSFGTAADAIHYAAFSIMKNFDLVGGHMVVMRAWHNSDATNIHEWLDDIQVAEAFQLYLTNPAGILALMMDQPDSELAQSWAAILQRAAELELHLPHEKDLDGGWGEILLAQGIDPEFIPSLDGNTLTVTDPVTGEDTVMHHIIGPGYEIVRIEGTDGNDIIEVVVDGPSITYVDGGEGNDIIEGSDQADILVGGTGEDIINGNDGNDWLHGGLGDDTIDGGAGEDLVVGGQNNDYLIGSADNDHVYGNDGDDYLFGNGGQDFLFGGSGNDVLDAGEGQFDEVYGGEGDDTLITGEFWHYLNGGKGNDTYILQGADKGNQINIKRGDGHDIITGVSTERTFINFDLSISVNELFLQQDENNLIVYVLGEDQSITVENFYNSNSTLRPDIGITGYDGELRAYVDGENWRSGIISLVANDSTISESRGSYNTISDIALAAGTSDLEGGSVWQPGENINGFHLLGDGNDNYITSDNIQIIYAGAGDDIITASDDDHIHNRFKAIYGDSGNDTIYARSGNDILVGGLGDDALYGGWMQDKLYGGEGDDDLYGEEGHDYISGGIGNDYIDGGIDDDDIEAGAGDDFIQGGAGNDLVKGDQGVDEIHGGDGNDTLYGGEGDDNINGDKGVDTIFGDAGNDNLDGGDDDDRISGGTGDDTLIGGAGSDILFAGDGNDTLVYRYGDNIGSQDEYNGEAGNDKLSVYFTAAEYLNTSIQRDILRYKSSSYYNNQTGITGAIFTFALFGLIVQNIEELDVYVDDVLQTISLNAYAGDLNDNVLSGSTSEDIIIGDAGNDTLQGLAGHDDLRGGLGDDDIQGGVGDDIAYGDSGNDVISGDEGDDQLFGGAGEDNISGGVGQDVINGGDHNDTITGNDGDDFLIGGDGDDTLTGGDGRDILIGGAGNDNLDGGLGDDLLVYRVSATDTDIIEGGAGTDILQIIVDSAMAASSSFQNDIINLQEAIDLGNSYAFSSLSLTVSNVEHLYILTDFTGLYSPVMAVDDNITVSNNSVHNLTFIINNDLNFSDGSISVKSLTASDNGNVILNNDGTITYVSDLNFMGVDSFDYTITDAKGHTSTATVTLNITSSSNVINGTTSSDTLNGTSGFDMINGLEGNDTIHGGDSDDILDGGSGHDSVYGEAGDDTLLYTTTISGSSENDVYDGGAGIDTMDYSGFGYAVYIDTIYSGADVSTMYLNYVVGGGGTWRYLGEVDNIENFILTNHSDVIYHDDNANILKGLDGNDRLLARGGDDILYGGDGYDRLWGGTGADTFVFELNSAFNDVDSIEDFSLSEGDMIDISNLLINYDPASNNIVDFVQITSGGAILVDSDGGADNFVQIATAYMSGLTDEAAFESDGTLITFVAPNNIAPNASDDNFSGAEDADIAGNLLSDNGNGLDTDAENHALTVISGTFVTVQGGLVDVSSNGDFIYTPATNFNGTDSFNYTLEDVYGGQDVGAITLTITPQNDDPISASDQFSGTEDVLISGNLLLDNGNGVDIDPDGDALTVVAATLTTVNNGSVSILSNGDFTYLPDTNFVGVDNFDYAVVDGMGGVDIANVTLNISPNVNVITGTTSSEILNGTSGIDIINSLEGNDTIYGGDSNDILDGGAGGDNVYGEAGDDTLIYSQVASTSSGSADIYDGGTGNDTIDFSTFGYAVYIDTNPANPDLQTMYLGHVFGGGGTWRTIGNVNNIENFIATEFDDGLFLDSNDNIIRGLGGDDRLLGYGGDDTLYGGDGYDRLWGGTGADTFVFEQNAAFNDVDVIEDFNLSEGDKIDISDVLFGYDPLSDSITDFVQITSSGDVLIDSDGGADNFVQIAEIYISSMTDELALENNGTLITV